MSKTFKKVSVVKLTPNFREATKIVEEPLRSPADDEVLIKILYSGVNATDVNRSAGRSLTSGKMPFDIGLEVCICKLINCKIYKSILIKALGVVHEAGINAKVKPGQFVVVLKTGSYSEYLVR